jgi:hypothetical protein
VQSSHGYDHRGFMTILDNILTIGELATSEERAGQSHTHPGGLQEGAGVGAKTGGGAKNGAAANFAKALTVITQALREVPEDCC